MQVLYTNIYKTFLTWFFEFERLCVEEVEDAITRLDDFPSDIVQAVAVADR